MNVMKLYKLGKHKGIFLYLIPAFQGKGSNINLIQYTFECILFFLNHALFRGILVWWNNSSDPVLNTFALIDQLSICGQLVVLIISAGYLKPIVNGGDWSTTNEPVAHGTWNLVQYKDHLLRYSDFHYIDMTIPLKVVIISEYVCIYADIAKKNHNHN